MKRSIEVTVSQFGQIHVEVAGVKGGSCADITCFLEEALGSVRHRRWKPEFYRNATRVNEQRLEQ